MQSGKLQFTNKGKATTPERSTKQPGVGVKLFIVWCAVGLVANFTLWISHWGAERYTDGSILPLMIVRLWLYSIVPVFGVSLFRLFKRRDYPVKEITVVALSGLLTAILFVTPFFGSNDDAEKFSIFYRIISVPLRS